MEIGSNAALTLRIDSNINWPKGKLAGLLMCVVYERSLPKGFAFGVVATDA
ncbi:hypothetical protein [Nostoc sp. 'Lobaria pulmonaria (5183) cyanobiont']|uniref:hypothetical protein n=1 Tax=Nostoc sp. 'Lobaria pulmonaria (5183) cyanobiont' TaxID=1618022 RepID=UPI00131A36C6|nr:hypothetical protein [Nostoc sp. 'Lobaria pulmonaria (5183) cyanobiont']